MAYGSSLSKTREPPLLSCSVRMHYYLALIVMLDAQGPGFVSFNLLRSTLDDMRAALVRLHVYHLDQTPAAMLKVWAKPRPGSSGIVVRPGFPPTASRSRYRPRFV
ncbi:hypothetical protein NEOLEDRAFT_780666 [Neolentinus lepideus HHB14362 ss-1]|uniref:Uncharacterized protein n=1 Tax=Neolentinus lepideus HHB14362 ss-1 TaxID=1314782 RepID=A0A165UWG0_9AGAM|nr:hypothetical protein NEOLEDRAFT_780666 [Neolentinus lepideus HHB14362 ss-1]